MLPGMTIDHAKQSSNAQPNPIQPIIIPITPEVIADFSKSLNPYQYFVGPNDKISITIWGHPEFSSPGGTNLATLQANSNNTLTTITGSGALGGSSADSGVGDYLVDGNGSIFFPLLGNIPVAGKTTTQIASLISQKIAVYVKNPQVTVRIDRFSSQQIYLMGELGGGGVTAAVTSVPITSTPMTLAFALAQGGGINVITANTGLVYVIRGSSSMTEPNVYWFDAHSPAAMIYAQNFPLLNNDVIFVSPADITRVNRVLSQILPSVQTVWFTKTLVDPNH